MLDFIIFVATSALLFVCLIVMSKGKDIFPKGLTEKYGALGGLYAFLTYVHVGAGIAAMAAMLTSYHATLKAMINQVAHEKAGAYYNIGIFMLLVATASAGAWWNFYAHGLYWSWEPQQLITAIVLAYTFVACIVYRYVSLRASTVIVIHSIQLMLFILLFSADSIFKGLHGYCSFIL